MINDFVIASLPMKILFTTVAGTIIFLVAGCANPTSNRDEATQWVEKTMAGLSLEKKVAQLICTDITGEYLPFDDPRMESWVKLAKEYGVGGFVCYGGTPQNVAHLLNRLQQEAEIPLLISADFEGGAGQQVVGASEFPANMAFAAARDENLMYEAAKIMAKEGRSMGIHLTYTPVADISISPDNPQESVRSFGGDYELMNKLLKMYVKGYHETGMFTTAKHFPGRGDMKALVEYPGFNYLDKSEAEFAQNELRAFQFAVDAGVDFIMTEHIAVPEATDGSLLPASVEPRLTKGIIRNKLGFKGIITTDDLWYDHVTNRFGTEEVAVMALEAGHDIILKPRDPVATIKAVTDAVRQGRISEASIDNSVTKLLHLKATLGLHKNRFTDENKVYQAVGTEAHKAVVRKVADRSFTLLRNEGVFPLKNWNPANTVHITVQKAENQPAVIELTGKLSASFPGINHFSLKPSMGQSYRETVKKAAQQADCIIISFFVDRTRHVDPAPVREEDIDLINNIIKSGKSKKVIAVSYGNPHIIRKISDIPAFLVGYGEGGWCGNQLIYFDTFTDIMKGTLTPSGRLPINVSDAYPIGFGLTYSQ